MTDAQIKLEDVKRTLIYQAWLNSGKNIYEYLRVSLNGCPICKVKK